MRGGDGATTDVPITPRDASDGRVSGLVFIMRLENFFYLILLWTSEQKSKIIERGSN